MNSIAAFMMVQAIDNERRASVEKRRQAKILRARLRGSRRDIRGRPVLALDPSLPTVHRGRVEDLTPTRTDPPGPHGPGVFAPVTQGYPRAVTRPTLTGTPDAVPTVELEELLEGGDLEVIDRWLAQADVVEIADELSRLPREQRAVPFRLLARDRALEVFELLDPSLQQELLEGLREANVRQLFEDLDPDDRARLTEEMPAKVARRLLAGLSPNERRLTVHAAGIPGGLGRPPDVAGGRQPARRHHRGRRARAAAAHR